MGEITWVFHSKGKLLEDKHLLNRKVIGVHREVAQALRSRGPIPSQLAPEALEGSRETRAKKISLSSNDNFERQLGGT